MKNVCVVIIIIGILVLLNVQTEGLTSKPSNFEKQKYTNEILANKNIFAKSTFYNAKEKMPWLDALIYEDVRQLVRQNNLNKNSINRVFY